MWIGFLGRCSRWLAAKHLGFVDDGFSVQRTDAQCRRRLYVDGICAGRAGVDVCQCSHGGRRACDGENDLLPGGLQKWYVQIIIPVVFALMGPRAAWRALDPNAGGGHGAPSSNEPHHDMSPRRRKLRWLICGVTLILAIVMFVIGFWHDGSPKLQALVAKTENSSDW